MRKTFRRRICIGIVTKRGRTIYGHRVVVLTRTTETRSALFSRFFHFPGIKLCFPANNNNRMRSSGRVWYIPIHIKFTRKRLCTYIIGTHAIYLPYYIPTAKTASINFELIHPTAYYILYARVYLFIYRFQRHADLVG